MPIPEKIEEDEKGQDDLNQHPNRAGGEFRGAFTDLAGHALELTAEVDLLLERGEERSYQGIRANCSRHWPP